MIKINLALLKQSVTAVGGDGSGTQATGITSATRGAFKFNTRLDGLEDLPLKRIIILTGAAIVIQYATGTYQQGEVDGVTAKIETVKAEQAKLQSDFAKTKDYLPLKKQLEADENMIRTKIRTVRSLIVDRQTPPRLFAALSGATPPEVWLNEVKIEIDKVELKGQAASVGDIPDFMKLVGESAYFTDIILEETRAAKDEKANDIATFSLRANRRHEVSTE